MRTSEDILEVWKEEDGGNLETETQRKGRVETHEDVRDFEVEK